MIFVTIAREADKRYAMSAKFSGTISVTGNYIIMENTTHISKTPIANGRSKLALKSVGGSHLSLRFHSTKRNFSCPSVTQLIVGI